MIRIGITGQSGFIGTHLYNSLILYNNEFECIPFEDSYFLNQTELRLFVCKCDVIVHLAALNRHPDPSLLYETNISLIKDLIYAMEMEHVHPHVIFSSSTQEEMENEYGKSKKLGRQMLEEWAKRNNASFTGLVVPNVFGPFGCPNYNSFIATFCYKLTHGEVPEILQDNTISLIYVGSLCQYIINKIKMVGKMLNPMVNCYTIPCDFEKRVTDILALLCGFKDLYFKQGFIPELRDKNELNLFNTFRSYIDHAAHFPVSLIKHADSRGVFVETIKLGIGGQISFSTTIPGITRGNHYHTRKIERFTVIKGKARIQLRRIGTDEILNFDLDGEYPSYVDMPIWYTHNITNVGNEDLYTQFWINEWYNPEDSDTYFKTV